MILSFKPQFKAPILEGSKIHTIREDKPNRWEKGKRIHFATGVRTKAYDNFKTGYCYQTQRISIYHRQNQIRVFIDGRLFGKAYHLGLDDICLYSTDLDALALNDGFSGLSEFFHWFNKDFQGKIIHWTDFSYLTD